MLCVPKDRVTDNRSQLLFDQPSGCMEVKTNSRVTSQPCIGLSTGNCPHSHTEAVPLVTEFLYLLSLWGSLEFVIFPVLCKMQRSTWKGSEPTSQARSQIIWGGKVGYLFFGFGTTSWVVDIRFTAIFWKLGLPFRILTECKHQEQKEKGAQLLRWTLKSPCLAGLNIFFHQMFDHFKIRKQLGIWKRRRVM